MSDRVKFDCYHCSSRLRASTKYVGRRFDCPACQKPLIVPATVLDENQPVLVFDDEFNAVLSGS